MSTPTKMRLARVGGQEPPEAAAAPERIDRTRDEIALRAGDLELSDPDALDLAAELYVAIHEQLAGRATSLRGPRRPKYFREQLRGVHPLTLEDVSRLVLAVPDHLVPFLRVLAARLGYALQPVRESRVALHEATACVAEAAGATVATVQRAAADGTVDPVEARRIEAEIEGLESRLGALRASLRAAGE